MGRAYDSAEYKRNRKSLIGLPCSRCQEPADTVDHILPVKRGGSNHISNLRPMCGKCNSALGGHMNKGKHKRRRRWRNGRY